MIFDHVLAMDLIRARVILAGSGLVGATGELGSQADLAILPGGNIVRFRRVGLSTSARILHPAGNPLTTDAPIDDPVSFANFMSAVDGCIQRLFRGPSPVFLELANEIVWDIRHNALPVVLPAKIDLPDPIGTWTPRPDALTLIDAMTAEDRVRPRTVEGYLYPDRVPATPVTRERNMLQWLERIDSWLIRSQGAVPCTVYGDGYRWIKVETVPGLVAANRRMGRSEGYLGVGGEPTPAEISDVQRGLRRRQVMHSEFLDDALPIYVLRRDGSEDTVMACVAPRTEHLVVMGSISSPWVSEAADLLRDSLGIGGQALRH